MIRNPNGVSDDRQRRIDRTCRYKAGSVDDIEIIQVMRLAMRVKHAVCGVGAHAAGSVLMANALQRDTFLEVRVQRDGSRRMPGPLKNIDPTVFEAIERLNIIRRVRELNSPGAKFDSL